MVARVCVDRCGDLAVSGKSRCRDCEVKRETQRGTPSQRGYGAAHQAARKLLAMRLPDLCGYATLDPLCPRTIIRPVDKWVAAHVVDGDPARGWKVAHPGCNERAKVRR